MAPRDTNPTALRRRQLARQRLRAVLQVTTAPVRRHREKPRLGTAHPHMAILMCVCVPKSTYLYIYTLLTYALHIVKYVYMSQPANEPSLCDHSKSGLRPVEYWDSRAFRSLRFLLTHQKYLVAVSHVDVENVHTHPHTRQPSLLAASLASKQQLLFAVCPSAIAGSARPADSGQGLSIPW